MFELPVIILPLYAATLFGNKPSNPFSAAAGSEMSESDELKKILTRRQTLNDAIDSGETVDKKFVAVNKNVYTEFAEFSRKEIKEYEKKFKS